MDSSVECNINISSIFESQQQNKAFISQSTAKTRIKKLQVLMNYILENVDTLTSVLYNDLKKPHSEVILTELYPVVSEIKYAIRNLKKWIKPSNIKPKLAFLGSKNQFFYRPKGVVLIISPWNFPFQLSIIPLISAICAGNCVILKPSEISYHTSKFIKKVISHVFCENEITVVEGDAAIAQSLLELPFEHIFFTGSPKIGKLVMTAASKNLTSVTLELGGKSPVVIDSTANINEAARKIAWGKFMNCGQTCVAPDYIIVHEHLVDKFIELLKSYITKYFGSINSIELNPDYARLINASHFSRVKRLLEDSISQGSKIEFGGIINEKEHFISPTLISNVSLNCSIMKEEIFGPLLPILTYNNLSDAISLINTRPNPLALYIFSKSKKDIEVVLQNVASGSILINDVVVHFSNIKLPFGGVKESGFGKTHGYYGFKSFSNQLAVMKQPSHTLMEFLYPPYTKSVQRLLKLVLKYL